MDNNEHGLSDADIAAANDLIKDVRSGTDQANIQEVIDASTQGAGALDVGQQQYQTPEWMVKPLASLLPAGHHDNVVDPQCASGHLINGIAANHRFGTEIDRRFTTQEATNSATSYGQLQRITGNCVTVWETMDELYPDLRFACMVANPPFGLKWKVKDRLASTDDVTLAIDSTQWTWDLIKKRLAVNGSGFLISNANTLERLGIVDDPWVYLYQRFPAGVWKDCMVEIGIVHFANKKEGYGENSPDAKQEKVIKVWTHVPSPSEMVGLNRETAFTARYHRPYSFGALQQGWAQLSSIITEESRTRPKYNIYLDDDGMLRTYLSTRNRMKVKREDLEKLVRINKCHPLTLTTERETRKLLHSYMTAGVYIIEPSARIAIAEALKEVASLACPIRPVTDFELVAYADEEDTLKCRGIDPRRKILLTPDRFYEVRTGTYTFKENFSRKKVHYDEKTQKTTIREHDIELTGEDRYIEITDDRGHLHRFMDRPDHGSTYQHPEELLWQLFEKPYVPSVAEVQEPEYERHQTAMRFNEMLAGFKYFPGQLDYYARMACKDYGLVAADVGCHAKGTLIMMADGTSKAVEEIVPGEHIMGWDSTARRVLRLSRGRQQMMRIVPVKGDPFVVNLDHILTLVQTNVHHSRKLAASNGAIRDVTVREYLTWPKEWRDNHKLFRRGIRLPQHRTESFSPYFMGMYLGDGGSRHDDISITKPDPEIREAVASECRAWGWKFRTATKADGNISHHIPGPWIRRELADHKLLGVESGARFIPALYKFNGRAERLELLAGLLDTDGSLDRSGVFDYISQSKQLAEDVAWLARSLGLAAYVSPCAKSCQTGAVGDYFRVCISGDIDIIPTRIPRKQARKRQQKKDVLRTGFKVERLEEDDFHGFSIEGDGRFLLADFTVTHNTGKSLGALTLIALKSPKRTLLIAPQGTMRSVGEEDEIDYQASQWVKEIQRFAPTDPVFQLFSREDWQAILNANGGELPPGIYITYPQAYFQNGGFEHLPESWEDIAEKKFCERFGLKFDRDRPLDECFHRNVGAANRKGIRCVAEPTLATAMEVKHGDCWEMVILDEAHLCCNLNAQITGKLLRLQPKHRFAMTATPIPNVVTNIFSLMGWLCVKDWHKGNMRNAAWPYAKEEIGRFNSTFLSTESDLTAQEDAKARGSKSWRRCGTKHSPIISSPARLLKLLKPNLAYISKEDCNPNLHGCEVIDVRVATGKEQTRLYQYWLNRGNYFPEFKNMLTIAQVQSTRLRGICAAPASVDYARDLCKSNFNPKTVTILQLIRDCLKRGEQVTVVSARVGQSQALASRLTDAGITLARIDSSVPAELHTAEANRFKKGDARVMLMGIKCAQGHSFEQCPNLIIGSLEWSYGTLHQAKGRVWRLNSPKVVKIWCVLHKNTIEELLFDRVATKQDAATLCLHGKRVPRDFKPMDDSEVLAEHIVNYKATNGEVFSETECESQWPELRRQLVLANVSVVESDVVALSA